MKKLISIWLVIFYFAISSGIDFNFHYCGGKFSSFKIYTEVKSCCCDITEEGINNGCCHNEIIHVQLKENYIANQNSTIESPKILDIFNLKTTELSDESDDILFSKLEYKDDSPPPIIPHRILQCSFIFYG